MDGDPGDLFGCCCCLDDLNSCVPANPGEIGGFLLLFASSSSSDTEWDGPHFGSSDDGLI